jgi:hypothetical protein
MEDADAMGVDDGSTRRMNRAGWLGAWSEIGVEEAARIELGDGEAEADDAVAETMVRSPKVVVMRVVKCIVIVRCSVYRD